MIAVDHLDVQPADRILEIGCGRGVAAMLICRRLDGGHLVAIDRSAKAIAAARARNAEAIAAGKVEFNRTALEDVEPAVLGQFGKVIAVNVNLFWVRPAHRELQLVGRLLAPGGRLLLCYDPPDTARMAQLETTLVDHLERAGYRRTAATLATAGTTLLAVTARFRRVADESVERGTMTALEGRRLGRSRGRITCSRSRSGRRCPRTPRCGSSWQKGFS